QVTVIVGSDQSQALEALTPGSTLTLDFCHPEEAARMITAFAATSPLEAVVGVDDETTLTAAMAAEALGVSHNAVASVAATRNNHHMRQFLAAGGVPPPRFACYSIDDDPAEVARQFTFPCVVKPLFLAASRGVIRANEPGQFVAAFQRVVALLRRHE